MMRKIERPTPPQRAAADPKVSAWVGANAGSGKTRVLTHRVARLLLAGTPPEKILCLTYTKAAAAEMQNRLFAMLGRWAMDDDAVLAAELEALAEIAPTPEEMRAARRLFARALETPGGLKIQTIHAFCDQLLRRYPLEAGVSPGFEVIEDRRAIEMIHLIREMLAEEAASGSSDAFDRLAGRVADGALDDLITALRNRRADFAWTLDEPSPEERLTAHFGKATEGAETVARQALGRLDWRALDRLAPLLEDVGGKADGVAAEAIRQSRRLSDVAPSEAAAALLGAYLTQKGEPRKRKGFPVKDVLNADPGAGPLTDAMLDWAAETQDALNAAGLAGRTRDLHLFAARLLALYEAAKARRGLLDFSDLIERARALLTASDMAAWVLYRLDQGIDHVLVDEAQDTAPAQWAVIDAIVEEFQAGEGARGLKRTLFVVGDEKQSIYSFQGAEPAAFAGMRALNARRLEALDDRLATPALDTSFRSAPAVLRFVDTLFEGDAATGLTAEGHPPRHAAHRAEAVGRVDLWPLIEPPEAPDDQPWWEPVDTPPPSGAKPRLARAVAREIRRIIEEERLPGGGRRVRAGDILVLVTRRDALARAILTGLKAEGVPVAGADRMKLAGELAVQDLLALMQVAVTPGDDLSLAAVLRSPLGGLTEDELFELAHDRGGSLLLALLTAEERFARAASLLADLTGRVDYLRPYEFLERVLIVHDGRRRLLARLGPEAEDAIDELLAQALTYETDDVPSLTGFLDWITRGAPTIKREMDAGRDEVRLMTVHGAKGLEAPVVILPDTLYKPPLRGPHFFAREAGNAPPIHVWAGSQDTDDRAARTAREEAQRLMEEERLRLLYVAATRAEDWLIVAGAGKAQEGSWYGLIESAMRRLPAREIPAPEGLEGATLRFEDEGRAEAPDVADSPHSSIPDRPDWLCAAPVERVKPRNAPSRLGHEDVEDIAGGVGLGRALAMERGEAVHLLLERLPDLPSAERRAAAEHLLSAGFPGLPPEIREDAIREADSVLAAPFAEEVFGPDSLAEVTVALDPPDPGPQRMIGRIDRLVIGPTHLLIVDIKTDSRPPSDLADVPSAYLSQLEAYSAGLRCIYHKFTISSAILWTSTQKLMGLPAAKS